MITQPLKGLKVLDFSRLLPGPLATSMMARLGADVSKIESPNRLDPVRSTHPVLFNALNNGKSFWSIPYEEKKGYNDIIERVKQADVIVEGFRPGTMDSWGIGYQQLKEVNPDLVYVSITGYGNRGCMSSVAGHDINYLSLSGLLSLLKDDNGRPVLPGFQIADVAGGAYSALIGMQSALLRRFLTFRSNHTSQYGGSHVNIDMTAGCLAMLAVPLSVQTAAAAEGIPPSSIQSSHLNVLDGHAANYSVYSTKDGRYMAVGALEPKFWRRLCNAVNRPEWGNLPQKDLIAGNIKRQMENIFIKKTQNEWISHFSSNDGDLTGLDACVTPVLELWEAQNFPYHTERGSFIDISDQNGKLIAEITALPFSIEY